MPVNVRTRSPSDTPERILHAALAAFSEKGFDGARTRDIADRADVTLGLVRYHFGNKEKLWKAAVKRAFGNVRTGLERILADPRIGDERELLRLLIRSHVLFVAENTEFIRIMHDEGKRRGARMRWIADRYVKPIFDMIVPVIVRAQEKGVLPSGIDPAHFVYILVGSIGMIFHQAEECKRVAGFDPADPSAVAAHSRAVEALFLKSADDANP